MKKHLLTLSVIITTITGIKAQAPEMGFEVWQAISPPLVNAEDPKGWASFNGASLLGMPITVSKETAAPAVGTISAKVTTDVLPSTLGTIANPFAPGQFLDTVGVLGIGKTMLSAPYAQYGYSYTTRSATLSFRFKYNPNPNAIAGIADTGYVFCMLTKWNSTTSSRDIIAQGEFKTHLAVSNWTSQSITLTYDAAFNNVMPDSQQVFVSSSIYKGNGAKKGSTMYVDEFVWSGYVSSGDIANQNVQVTIYPSPASTTVNFTSNVAAEKLTVLDITGRVIGTYDLTDNKVSISTENYSSGVYFYNLINANKEIISVDKFQVIK